MRMTSLKMVNIKKPMSQNIIVKKGDEMPSRRPVHVLNYI